MSKDHLEVVGRSNLRSDELQIDSGQNRSSLKNGNDAAITKAFVRTMFIEIKTTLLLVIEEVDIQLGKYFLDCLFLPAAKAAELSTPKLSASISRVWVDGLKLVILSADFLLIFSWLGQYIVFC